MRGFIGLRREAADGTADDRRVAVNSAFISLAGLTAGKIYSEWDEDLAGETDLLSSNTLFNIIRYNYYNGTFRAYVVVEELEDAGIISAEIDNNVGVSGLIGGTFGVVTATLLGSYDTDYEEGAVGAIVFADIRPGTLGVSGIYASGVNSYYAESEWAVAAEYALRVTDRFEIIPAAQYLGSVAQRNGNDDIVDADWTDNDAWTAGLTVNYKVTDGLTTKVTANYYDEDGRDDEVTGFVGVQRSF